MTPPPPDVIRYLRSALGPDADGPADAALLARFNRDRDEAAFELLVWRHAGMVLRVCRGVLRDHHAAEDACQAVFLALARQAGAVGRRGAVAGWLYRVARRVAHRAARRRVPAVPADRLPAPDPDPGLDPAVARVLQDELDRLPERYRVPVLLCFFEGLTHADAARRLGWPVGTVAGRIARAKELLYRRLTRRGVAAPAAGVAALLAAGPAAAVPPSFVGTTARAAAAFAGGAGVVPGVSATVLELANGVMRTMTATKLQWAAGVVALCGAIAAGGVWATAPGPAGQVPGSVGGPPAAARPADDPAKPAAGRTATAEQRRRSLKSLQKILVAIHSYHDTHTHLPADFRDKDGKPLLSWRVKLLPYLGEENLYKQFKLDEPWDSEHNLQLLAKLPDAYRVGFEPQGATHTYYQVFAGPGTPFGPSRFAAAGAEGGGEGGLAGAGGSGSVGGAGGPIAPGGVVPTGGAPPLPGTTGGAAGESGAGAAGLPPAVPNRQPAAPGPVRITHITDGTSNTLGVVEAGPPVPWTKPADLPCDPAKPPKLAGPFANALHVALMDGSAAALRRDIDPKALRILIGMDDGEPLIPDFRTLHARIPAETPEEKAALADQIARNQVLIAEIDQLMREQVGLLGGRNKRTGDVGSAEEQAEQLRQVAEELKAKIKKLRDELGAPEGGPVPRAEGVKK
jgi:RNA polymerase sigma factor (sigma-70 family)